MVFDVLQVNTIAPGMFETLLFLMMPEEKRKSLSNQVSGKKEEEEEVFSKLFETRLLFQQEREILMNLHIL